MRALPITDEIKEAVKKVAEFARDRVNWYEPGKSDWIPGDREEFVLNLISYRCVFSYTLIEKKLYRHLTVSIPGNRYPSPTAAFTIANMFGFEGGNVEKDLVMEPAEDWMFDVSNKYGCVTIAQEIIKDTSETMGGHKNGPESNRRVG